MIATSDDEFATELAGLNERASWYDFGQYQQSEPS